MLDLRALEALIDLALAEDIGLGDLTTAATVLPSVRGIGKIIAKSPGVIAGLAVAEQVFRQLAPNKSERAISFLPRIQDGETVESYTTIAEIEGSAKSILVGERTALNFLQRLSGTATLTTQFVNAISHTSAQIVDTRKTAAGWRLLQKYAVRVGGGRNHRFGLYDGILIKDNHIVAAGGIKSAIAGAKKTIPHTLKVEVEVKMLDQISEALEAGADIILLDNMTNTDMKIATARISGKALTEASGGITLDRVAGVAETGVDYISVGALTHSALPLDISLDLEIL